MPSPSHRYIGELVLSRYVIEKLIGVGSFAWVYRARDRREKVAVKILHSDQSTATVRFAREVRVLQALPYNQFVAQYVDHGHTNDGKPALVLEFVDGITLKTGMERRPTLSPPKAVAFVARLCEAFVGLHQLGVAHRDVKPDNILMSRTGAIKLIDFGLIRDAQGILKLLETEDPFEARVFQEELDEGVLAGTPEYMAPEQFSDSAVDDISEAKTDTWSDVFSLGVILFELLSGRKPFVMRDVPNDEYAQELLRYLRWRLRLRDMNLPPLPGIPKPLQSIVHKTLRRDPRRRHRDARALMSELVTYQKTGKIVEELDDSRTMVASYSEVLSAQEQKLSEELEDTNPNAGKHPSFTFFEVESPEGDSDPDESEPESVETKIGKLKRRPSQPEAVQYDGEEFSSEELTLVEKRSELKKSAPSESASHAPNHQLRELPRVESDDNARTEIHDKRSSSLQHEPYFPPQDEMLEDSFVEENLADPPLDGEPDVLIAPVDAPALASEEFFDDEDAVIAKGESEEINLAKLVPRRKKKRRRWP